MASFNPRHFIDWLIGDKSIADEVYQAVVEAPLAKTIPDDWKKPIIDTVLAAPEIMTKADGEAIRNELFNLKAHVANNISTTTALARESSAVVSDSLAKLAASRSSVPPKRAPIIATGDLTGANLLQYMKG